MTKEPSKLNDLAQFDTLAKSQEAGVLVDILHPETLDPLGITMVIAGPDSTRRKMATRKAIDKRLAKRKMRMTAADLEFEGQRALAACVISWTGVMVEGKVLECTMENAVELFRRFPFIQEQVDAEANDRASFFGISQTTSAST